MRGGDGERVGLIESADRRTAVAEVLGLDPPVATAPPPGRCDRRGRRWPPAPTRRPAAPRDRAGSAAAVAPVRAPPHLWLRERGLELLEAQPLTRRGIEGGRATYRPRQYGCRRPRAAAGLAFGQRLPAALEAPDSCAVTIRRVLAARSMGGFAGAQRGRVPLRDVGVGFSSETRRPATSSYEKPPACIFRVRELLAALGVPGSRRTPSGRGGKRAADRPSSTRATRTGRPRPRCSPRCRATAGARAGLERDDQVAHARKRRRGSGARPRGRAAAAADAEPGAPTSRRGARGQTSRSKGRTPYTASNSVMQNEN